MISFNIVGYMIFALVTSITPGPNNYLLFSYGKTYGFKDSSRLMVGILLGFFILLYTAGYGIAELITNSSTLGIALKVVSSIWLFYLAIVLSKLNSDTLENSDAKVGFYHGLFMQFVNPKAWIMAITGASAFLPHYENIHLNVFVFAITFGLIGIPCMISWIAFGGWISKMLKSEKANRFIGLSLFVLMNISIVMIWI